MLGPKLFAALKVIYPVLFHTYWDNCYAEPITATVDGVSISDGGDFTINSTVEWTWPHGGTGADNGATDEGGGTGHALGFNLGNVYLVTMMTTIMHGTPILNLGTAHQTQPNFQVQTEYYMLNLEQQGLIVARIIQLHLV